MILRTIPARFEFVARMLRHESRPRRELAECENPGRQSEEGSQRGTESRRKRQQTTPALAPQRIARRPKKNKKEQSELCSLREKPKLASAVGTDLLIIER